MNGAASDGGWGAADSRRSAYASLGAVRDCLEARRGDDYRAEDVALREVAGMVLVSVNVNMSVPGRAPEPAFMPDETPERYQERHELERLRWQSYVAEQVTANLRRDDFELESISNDPDNADPIDALALGSAPVAVVYA
ncbi:hypothetical protein [Amycolatopsis sp. NPDC004079]|uniref:hypothetical protein n=1 Tax=Amycolatopsis sp. NPDC004079 TaxID=3154549 RepID=UPI0033AE8D7C